MFDYFLHLFILGSISFVLFKTWKTFPLRSWYWIGLGIKLLGGVAMGLIYFYYYKSGDTIVYFQKAAELASWREEGWISFFRKLYAYNIAYSYEYGIARNNFIESVFSIVYIFCNGHYWIMSLYFSFFSFIGFFYFANKLYAYYPLHKLTLGLAFFVYPSVVFWSSGLSKESIALSSLFIVIAFLIDKEKKKNTKQILFLILGLSLGWIVYKIKFYYLVIGLACFGAYALVCRVNTIISPKRKGIVLIFVLIFLILIYFFLSNVHHTLYPSQLLFEMVNNHRMIMDVSPTHTIVYSHLEPTFKSFLINMPLALFSGLFRPLVGDGYTGLYGVSIVENMFLFLCFIVMWWSRMKTRIFEFSLFSFICWLYIIICAFSLALVCPNLGSLMRYKVMFLPFFVFFILKNNAWIEGLVRKIGIKK